MLNIWCKLLKIKVSKLEGKGALEKLELEEKGTVSQVPHSNAHSSDFYVYFFFQKIFSFIIDKNGQGL